jgi:hypothetical protein
MGWKLAGAFAAFMAFVLIVTAVKYYLREYASRFASLGDSDG